MKIIKLISFIIGFALPFVFGGSIQIPNGMGLILVCVFFFGIIGKLLLQAFTRPFMNTASQSQMPDLKVRLLDFFSSGFLFIGLGSFVSELIFYSSIGVIPITLMLFGVSIYLGNHYISGKDWFFNQ